MKKTIFIFLLIGCSTLMAQSTWKVDAGHSNINFSISHLVISEVTGNFGKFDIEAVANDAFSDPTFTVTIETASISTSNERRDGHLKSDDFFAAEAHPTMTFKSNSYKKTGDKTFLLDGDFTIRGNTKPIQLKGKLNGIITDQRSKKLKAGIKLTGTIARKEFGVGGDNAALGDDVEIIINLEMAQQ
ncbi:MAG: polyisoprenoid-binding protein [Flavobacteriaceae bacterium]|nr:MAG: polyisoprenoid-binding protein [Flavobacteriaceae bacterium]